jgi:hypothetical protein
MPQLHHPTGIIREGSAGEGRGRGRGAHLTKPAWMTQGNSKGLAPEGGSGMPKPQYPTGIRELGAGEGRGRGRGVHMTKPAWMTHDAGT